MKNIIFILGAVDLEMTAIERLLLDQNQTVAYAAGTGREPGTVARCHPGNANKFTFTISPSGESVSVKTFDQVILVECSPENAGEFDNIKVVDHHFPGQPGYGKKPVEFLTGSSIGQVCQMLEVTPTQEQRIIAAADHCLAAAYAGDCPGVTADQVLAIRLPEQCARQRVSVEEGKLAIETAVALLNSPIETVSFGNQEIPDFRKNGALPFMVEAGTITGNSFLAHVDSRPGQETKVMLSSANPAVIQDFLDSAAAELSILETYGNPNRGFAGGTQQ